MATLFSEAVVMRLRRGVVAVALLIGLPNRPAHAQVQMSTADSAIIARELAAWDALQKKDSGATFTRVVGNSPMWILMGPDGITRRPAADVGREITVNCDRPGKNQLDSARVEHVTSDVVLLTYRISASERCKPDTTLVNTTLYSMTVWARRNGRWQLVSQAWTPVGK